MMTVFPFEQLVRSESAENQAEWAKSAASTLLKSERASHEILDIGLLLLGLCEEDLLSSVSQLAAVFSEGLLIGEPKIRYVLEPEVLEPWLCVSISSASEDLGHVCGSLNDHRALITAIDDAVGDASVTAEISASMLLAYRRAFGSTASGRVRCVATSAFYKPAPTDPGGPRGAAAVRAA